MLWVRRALVLAALLALPLVAPTSGACAVPCGRIYPLILIQLDGDATMWNVTKAAPVTVDATLTYKFDMMNEGYTAASPNEPVVIRFEYPRKPDWADITVEPEAITVDVNNPTYAQPDLAEPTNPQAQFVFSAPITIRVSLVGQPILKDGYDFAKLLVFAKSTESGLYQSGYGIKELRVVPEGALHEADVAGTRDVFTTSPLPALALAPVTASFAGTSVTLTPPAAPAFWVPGEFIATVEPALRGRMVLAIHDEWGALVASTTPVDSATGEARVNATIAKPGRHTATLTLLPDSGTLTPPMTYALDFDAGALDAEGFAYPKSYLVATSEPIPRPLGSSADALAQFERDIPFFAYDTAQSVSASVALVSDAPVDLGRSAANLQFSLHDPDGNMLQAGSVDPTKPTWSIRVGSLPIDGWYVLRVKGVGVPVTARFDARIEAAYAAAPLARNRADGVPDLTGGVVPLAGGNLTLPVDALAVWAPGDLTPAIDRGEGVAYSVTVYDAQGRLAYASGVREGASTFSPPAPGAYRAFVFAEPTLRGLPFSPMVRAFAFDVGGVNVTVASTFAIDDVYEAPGAATDTLLGFHAVHVLPGAAAPTVEGGDLVDANGGAADGAAEGVVYLRVVGAGPSPQGGPLPVKLEQSYGSPVSLGGPRAEAPEGAAGGEDGFAVPGLAVGVALAAVGALAVAIALVRRA